MADVNPRVQNGEICARCSVEFDGAHGTPVLCHHCHDMGKVISGTPTMFALPKAWLEEKVK